MAGIMVGEEFWMASEDINVPPIVILSACHSSPRGMGAVNIADMFIRNGAISVLGTFIASVSSAGREDIALVGIDNEEGQLNALKDGRYYKATVAQDSYSIGEEAMNAALSAIDGKKTGDVVVPGILVTADNVEEYLTDDQAKKDELEEYK